MRTPRHHSPHPRHAESDPRARLLDAAIKLFAEHGPDAVGIRELAREAGVNVAAVNYYFNGKENLYLEALKQCFNSGPEEMDHLAALLAEARRDGTPEGARRMIRAYIEGFIYSLLGGDRARHQTGLVSREMNQPSPALDVIVDEFILPKSNVLRDLIALARPDLDAEKLMFYTASIVGQCLHYSFTMPVTLRMFRRKKMTPDFLRHVADHIADFSLRALEPPVAVSPKP